MRFEIEVYHWVVGGFDHRINRRWNRTYTPWAHMLLLMCSWGGY